MTDSTDTQASSSQPSIAVAQAPAGMLVGAYAVLVFPKDTSESAIFYGPFEDLNDATKWANLLTGIVTIHPICTPTMNRG